MNSFSTHLSKPQHAARKRYIIIKYVYLIKVSHQSLNWYSGMGEIPLLSRKLLRTTSMEIIRNILKM